MMLIGKKKFLLSGTDYNEFIMVASAMLNPEIVDDHPQLFTLNETRILLRKC